jgi:hypothetical protein
MFSVLELIHMYGGRRLRSASDQLRVNFSFVTPVSYSPISEVISHRYHIDSPKYDVYLSYLF